jgi:hypothetical protein
VLGSTAPASSTDNSKNIDNPSPAGLEENELKPILFCDRNGLTENRTRLDRTRAEGGNFEFRISNFEFFIATCASN